MADKQPILGVFSGSLALMRELQNQETFKMETPFGAPSGGILTGTIAGKKIVVLQRHGQNHTFSPSAVNYRANVWAMKSFGVTHLLSLSAVGSLSGNIEPGRIVIPDQLIDWTKGIRKHTFFEGDNDLVAHVAMAKPICPEFSGAIFSACQSIKNYYYCRRNATLVVIEGPTFSTRAESVFFREFLKADLVGMTALPEAKLAREIGICYAIICLVTDYDAWRDGDEVDAQKVAKGLEPFLILPSLIFPNLLQSLPEQSCGCPNALCGAVATRRGSVPPQKIEKKYSLFKME